MKSIVRPNVLHQNVRTFDQSKYIVPMLEIVELPLTLQLLQMSIVSIEEG
jgi:hypothetical protein